MLTASVFSVSHCNLHQSLETVAPLPYHAHAASKRPNTTLHMQTRSCQQQDRTQGHELRKRTTSQASPEAPMTAAASLLMTSSRVLSRHISCKRSKFREHKTPPRKREANDGATESDVVVAKPRMRDSPLPPLPPSSP